MDLVQQCLACGTKLRVPPSSLGRTARCTKCGATFKICADAILPVNAGSPTPSVAVVSKAAPQRRVFPANAESNKTPSAFGCTMGLLSVVALGLLIMIGVSWSEPIAKIEPQAGESRAQTSAQADDKAQRNENLPPEGSSSLEEFPLSESFKKKVHVWAMAEEFVKASLRSPNTASFGGVFDYQNPAFTVVEIGGGEYRVVGWVAVEDATRTKIYTRFKCELKDMGGDNWKCTSLDFFEW
jgi:hypothetical protein